MLKLIYDYGKPTEEKIKDKAELEKRLRELKVISESGECAFMDIDVEENGRAWTEDDFNAFFKERMI